jgi:hypothetical protein
MQRSNQDKFWMLFTWEQGFKAVLFHCFPKCINSLAVVDENGEAVRNDKLSPNE